MERSTVYVFGAKDQLAEYLLGGFKCVCPFIIDLSNLSISCMCKQVP